MKNTFLMTLLIAMASITARANTYNISFAPYCDAMELTTSGTPAIYVSGVHDFSGCPDLGSAHNEYIGGFRHSFYRSIDPGRSSTIMDLMDPYYGYIYGQPYPLEYLISTDQTCAWSTYHDFEGSGHALGNVGTCSFFKGSPPQGKNSLTSAGAPPE